MFHFVLFLLFISTIKTDFEFEQKPCPKNCDFCLHQYDFIEGTYRIRKSGKWCLAEDIEFEPEKAQKLPLSNPHEDKDGEDTISGFPNNDELYPGSEKLKDGPFCLGWFAAITIEVDNVSLNMRGKTLKMGPNMAINQRFFTLIEVANSAFIKDQGPNDFLGKIPFKAVKNIKIFNGVLGFNSHIGIHSNGATNVLVKDILVKDYEVVGIQFNGFTNLKMINVEVKDSLRTIPISSFYSSARFVMAAFIKSGLHLVDHKFVDFYKNKKSYKQIYDELKTVMNIAYRIGIKKPFKNDLTNPLWLKNKIQFENPKGLPYASTLFGIILHNLGAGVEGFGTSKLKNSKNAYLKNIKIHNLANDVFEIPIQVYNDCDMYASKKSRAEYAMIGPFGDVYDFRFFFNKRNRNLINDGQYGKVLKEKPAYIGKVLTNAQIAVGLLKTDEDIGLRQFAYTSNLNSDKGFKGSWSLAKNGNPFLNWVLFNKPLPNCTHNFLCNNDVMFHTDKGIIGLRIDKVEKVVLNNIQIFNLHNESPLPSFACRNYSGPHDGGNLHQREYEGGMITDVRGISIIDSDVYMDLTKKYITTKNGKKVLAKNRISNLKSDFGDVSAIHIMAKGTLTFSKKSARPIISAIKSGAKLTKKLVLKLANDYRIPYPNNFLSCRYLVDTAKKAKINGGFTPKKCFDPVKKYLPKSKNSIKTSLSKTKTKTKKVAAHSIFKNIQKPDSNSNDLVRTSLLSLPGLVLIFSFFSLIVTFLFCWICLFKQKNKKIAKYSQVRCDSESESEFEFEN